MISEASPTNGAVVITSSLADKQHFAINFPYCDVGDISVYQNRAGSETCLVSGTDFTVSGGTASGGHFVGGTVTLTSAAQVDDIVAIVRETGRSQNLNLTNGSVMPAEAFNNALDRIVCMIQELTYTVTRALTVGPTSSVTSAELAQQLSDAVVAAEVAQKKSEEVTSSLVKIETITSTSALSGGTLNIFIPTDADSNALFAEIELATDKDFTTNLIQLYSATDFGKMVVFSDGSFYPLEAAGIPPYYYGDTLVVKLDQVPGFDSGKFYYCRCRWWDKSAYSIWYGCRFVGGGYIVNNAAGGIGAEGAGSDLDAITPQQFDDNTGVDTNTYCLVVLPSISGRTVVSQGFYPNYSSLYLETVSMGGRINDTAYAGIYSKVQPGVYENIASNGAVLVRQNISDDVGNKMIRWSFVGVSGGLCYRGYECTPDGGVTADYKWVSGYLQPQYNPLNLDVEPWQITNTAGAIVSSGVNSIILGNSTFSAPNLIASCVYSSSTQED